MTTNLSKSSTVISIFQKLFGAFYGNGLYGMSEYGVTDGASSVATNISKSSTSISNLTKS